MPQIVTSNVAYGHVSTAHFISRTRNFVDLTRPQLFKRWIELSTGKITIQRISIRETNCTIHWIEINYLVDLWTTEARALSFNIHMQILHTDVHNFLEQLFERICYRIKEFPLRWPWSSCMAIVKRKLILIQGIRIIYIAQEPLEWKCCRMGPMVFRLYPRRLKDLTTCRDETIKQYLLLSYLNTLRVGLAEIDLLLWILVLNFLTQTRGSSHTKGGSRWVRWQVDMYGSSGS